MAKNTIQTSNKKRVLDKLMNSFGSDMRFARYYANIIKNLPGYRPFDEMSPEEFDLFIESAVKAVGDESTRLANLHKSDMYGPIHQKGGELFRDSWPHTWDREKFLKTLGREASKDQFATGIKKDAHIGELSIGDRNKLLYSGLTDEEIDMLADKFRKEYQDKIISQVEEEKARREVAENKELSDKYANSTFGKVSSVFANETYNLIKEKIAKGEDYTDDFAALAKAVGIDSAVWAVSLLGGGLLTKAGGKLLSKIPAASKFTNKIPNVIKNAVAPLGSAAIDASADAVGEYGRQQVSAYQDGTDWGNIRNVWTTSATLPGTVAGVSGLIAQVPGAQKIMRPIMKQIRQNRMLGSEKELANIDDLFDDIAELSKRSETDPIANEILQGKLIEAKKFIDGHPITDGPISMEEIKRLASDRAGREAYTLPPTEESVKEMISIKNGTADPGIAMKRFATETAEEASDAASARFEKYKNTFPENWADLEDARAAGALVSVGKGINTAVPMIAKTEVGIDRGNSAKKREYSEHADIDPVTEQMWKKGMFVRGSNQRINPLYLEWLETHPEYAVVK